MTLLAVTLALGLSACGKKGPPELPQETAKPAESEEGDFEPQGSLF